MSTEKKRWVLSTSYMPSHLSTSYIPSHHLLRTCHPIINHVHVIAFSACTCHRMIYAIHIIALFTSYISPHYLLRTYHRAYYRAYYRSVYAYILEYTYYASHSPTTPAPARHSSREVDDTHAQSLWFAGRNCQAQRFFFNVYTSVGCASPHLSALY